MDLAIVVAIVIFAGACLLAVHQSRANGWSISQKIGTTIALVGAAIGLFVSQITSIDLSPLSIETVGALIMLSGILFIIFWQPDQEA